MAISQFRKQACQSTNQSLTKAALLSFFTGSSIQDLLNNIGIDNWEIISFNSIRREVCVRISDNIGERTISLTLPTLSNSSL